MNSPFQRDAVMEFAEAFREEGLKVLLYYSILDAHHDIPKGWVRKDHTQFIKDQLTELFSCRRTRAFSLHLSGLLNIE
jgi:alpha-L-fucosidase